MSDEEKSIRWRQQLLGAAIVFGLVGVGAGLYWNREATSAYRTGKKLAKAAVGGAVVGAAIGVGLVGLLRVFGVADVTPLPSVSLDRLLGSLGSFQRSDSE